MGRRLQLNIYMNRATWQTDEHNQQVSKMGESASLSLVSMDGGPHSSGEKQLRGVTESRIQIFALGDSRKAVKS